MTRWIPWSEWREWGTRGAYVIVKGMKMHTWGRYRIRWLERK